MGLLDSVLSAALGGQKSADGAGGGLAAGGLGGLIGLVASNPKLLQAALSMLGNDSNIGGLAGLVQKFQQAGLGDIVASWISGGANQPVSGSQLSQVLGSEAVSGLGQKLGITPEVAASQLAQFLPGLIDQLTPKGAAPAEGLGNANDLMGMLGGLMKR